MTTTLVVILSALGWWLLSVAKTLLGPLIVAEVRGYLDDRLKRRVERAAMLLPRELRDGMRSEWLAELAELHDRPRLAFRYARGLVEAARAIEAEFDPSGTKLFVGSLAWSTTDESLGALFACVADVESARVVTDRETGRSRGFGFVQFASAEQAATAVATLNEYDLDGRQITVNVARERQER